MDKNIAFVEHEIGMRLLDKLIGLPLNTKVVACLSANPQLFTPELQHISTNIIELYSLEEINTFANNTVELLIANCCLPIGNELPTFLLNIQQKLAIDGLLLFATFGPDTLRELNLQTPYTDMHMLGDLLLQQNFLNPVVDMEYLTLTYTEATTLYNDLNCLFEIQSNMLETLTFPCQITFEIIYGIAYKQKNKQFKDTAGNTFIPLDDIKHLP